MKKKLLVIFLSLIMTISFPIQTWATENNGDKGPDIGNLEIITEDIDMPTGGDEIPVDIPTVNDASELEGNINLGIFAPSSFDLRTSNLVTSTKDQGMTNTCWAFASLAVCEIEAMSKGISDADFSELYAVWYSNMLHKAEGLQVVGTDGELVDPFYGIADNGEYIASRMISWAGPADEAAIGGEYPAYGSASDETVAMMDALDEMDGSVMNGLHVQDVEYLPSPINRVSGFKYDGYNEDGTNAIKKTLTDSKRAVMILLKSAPTNNGAGCDYYNYENDAQYVDDENVVLDHAVTIVGFDDNYPAENFNIAPEGNGAWICKNSWGTLDTYMDDLLDGVRDNRDLALEEYGEAFPKADLETVTDEELAAWLYDLMVPVDREGYFYVSYYDKSLYHPMIFGLEDNDYTVNHQYDQLNMLSATTQKQSVDNAKVANVFAAESSEEVMAVSVYTAQPGMTASIEVYKLSDDSENPEDGELVSSQEETLTWAGFHTVELDNSVSVNSGEKFAVVERITNAEGNTYTPVELGYTDKNGYTYVVADNKEGESYIYTDESGWKDMTELEDIFAGYKAGNVMIKAFAVTTEDDSEAGDEPDPDVDDDKNSEDSKPVDGDNDSSDNGTDAGTVVTPGDGDTDGSSEPGADANVDQNDSSNGENASEPEAEINTENVSDEPGDEVAGDEEIMAYSDDEDISGDDAEETGESAKKSGKAETGDRQNLLLYLGIMAVAVVILFAVIRRRSNKDTYESKH